MKIPGTKYAVRELQAGDMTVLHPLFSQGDEVLALLNEGPMEAARLACQLAEPLITAIAHLLDVPREEIAVLPLHELLVLLEAAIPVWMSLNATYLEAQVTPVVKRLTTLINDAAMPSDQSAHL